MYGDEPRRRHREGIGEKHGLLGIIWLVESLGGERRCARAALFIDREQLLDALLRRVESRLRNPRQSYSFLEEPQRVFER